MRAFQRLSAVLVSLALVAAACGGSGDDGNGDGALAELPECPVDAHLEADGTVEVVVWHSYVGLTKQTLEALAADYNESQDKVEVKIQSQGTSYDELLRKYEQAIPTDDLPGIAILEDTTAQFMADSGTILPAQSCLDVDEDERASVDSWLPVARDYYTIDGVLWPVSLNVSTIMLYYNRDHFEQAGLDPDDPPQTLDEVRETAQALKDAGASTQPLSFLLQPWFIEYWMTGVGQEVVNGDNGRDELATMGTLDNEEAQGVYNWINDMTADGLMAPVSGTPGQINHYLNMLGTSSMLFETSTAITTIIGILEGSLDPEELGADLDLSGLPPIDLNISANLFPGIEEPGKGQVGGGVWYIPSTNDPEVQAAAWDFAKFINEPANQVRWTLEGSYLPVNQEAAESPELQEAWETTRGGQWQAIAFEGLLNVDPTFPGPLIGPYDDFREIVRKSLDDMVLAGTSPEDALSSANDQITEALETYADENF